jgi:hypothetical protein
MKRLLPAIAAVLLLSGCATGSPSSAPTEAAAEGASENVDSCTYLSGGVLDDAGDLLIDYTKDRTSVDQSDVDSVIERFDTAQSGATGDLDVAIGDVQDVLSDLRMRYTGSDPLYPVDYQAFSDSMDDVYAVCIDVLK